ncbi:MAG: DUF547 domain-containing protein [Pseudomonadota bacterium]
MIRIVALVLLLTAAACTRVERQFLPEPTLLGGEFARFAEAPGATVDHAPWDAFLARYRSVDEAGIARLAYAEVTPADRAALDGYIARLAAVDPARLDRDTALAYWINLYNAVTVAIVLDAYPVGSIRDISDGPLPTGPWDRPVVSVAGRRLSLNDIEHRIIRPAFDEPRIHYAVNCAAAGCPNLQATAWRGADLVARLTEAERRYVTDARGVRVDADGRVSASKIYAWFAEDFGTHADLVAYLATNAGPEEAAALGRHRRIDRYHYDWSLNDR